MSLTTGFDFRNFECDANRRHSDTKEGIAFSAMTAMQMEKLAFVKIETPLGYENVETPWIPIRDRESGEDKATFWDTRMGNFEVKGFPHQACSTCTISYPSTNKTERSNETDPEKEKFKQLGIGIYRNINTRCLGHFGYIEMPLKDKNNWQLFYNPLLFNDLMHIIRSLCFFCHSLRASSWNIARMEATLTLLKKGLIGESIELMNKFEKFTLHDSKNIELLKKKFPEGTPFEVIAKTYILSNSKISVDEDTDPIHPSILDFQVNIIDKFIKELRNSSKKCSHCSGISPTIKHKDGQLYFQFGVNDLAYNKTQGFVTQDDIDRWIFERNVFKRQLLHLQVDFACVLTKDFCLNHRSLVSHLFPNLGTPTVNIPFKNKLDFEDAFQVFFIDRVLVPPLSQRLRDSIQLTKTGVIIADARTKKLNEILQHAIQISSFFKLAKSSNITEKQIIIHESNIIRMQSKINELYSETLEQFAKKEGLFRMNMMGKRVNQACRSVISPDYTIEPDEVLLPRRFAKNLSFPEPITFHSVSRVNFIKKCIMNGPHIYPGASHIEKSFGDGRKEILSIIGNQEYRTQLSQQCISLAKSGVNVVIHRHVVDGDALLFNRQPTLHRPSIMGFKAKVLSSLKTLRFHYVNGKSFNADFDGDEMNIHIPQSYTCKAEVTTLMQSCYHFLSFTSGKPLRGLIQDHIVSGVILSLPNTYLTYDQYQQLLFVSLEPYIIGGKIDNMRSLIPLPAILKPMLFTGKQLFSSIVRWISGVLEGNTGLTTKSQCQIPSDYHIHKFQDHSQLIFPNEHQVVFINSELLTGIIDKAQLGPSDSSITHLVYELYGPHAVGNFFGAIGRLLTTFLQSQGMSMGLDDLMILNSKKQIQMLKVLDESALSALSEADSVSQISKHSNSFVKDFMPKELKKKFPYNQLTLMTATGAKGSAVNATQMSLVLGQQLFDGQRVKPMGSGKTLPSFFKNDQRARAYGYALGKFASGIRPSEYTIHAMAGRDGLIDTGIKTSRSGYLQRCLIKGLESITVHWDGTVRSSDGSIIQFKYGEDGLDHCKIRYMNDYQSVIWNWSDFSSKNPISSNATGKYVISHLPSHVKESINKFEFSLWNNQSIVTKRKKARNLDTQRKDNIHRYLEVKYPSCKIEPGESVGLLAAQACGEPSTQMTLNTFHQAGQTASHVSEGIPRLKELIIYGSVTKPAVILPVKNPTPEDLVLIEKIINAATPLKLKTALADIDEPIQWYIERVNSVANINMLLSFSKSKLSSIAKRKFISEKEHVELFKISLKKFSLECIKKMRGIIRHRSINKESEIEDANMDETSHVEQTSSIGGDHLSFDNESDDSHVSNDPYMSSNESTISTTDAFLGKSDHELIIDESKHSRANRKVSQNDTYFYFNSINLTVSSGKIQILIQPVSYNKGRNKDSIQDYFGVQVIFSLPSNIIVVVPSILRSVLDIAYFPSILPQFNVARWVPNDDKTGGDLIFQDEGITMSKVTKLVLNIAPRSHSINIYSLYSTDYHDIIQSLGIEGSYHALVKEYQKLFSMYSVDRRHLTLIADNSMRGGIWEKYNFTGLISHDPSPIFQMTFSTSTKFLQKSIRCGLPDNLSSFSSSIVLGEEPKVGTSLTKLQMPSDLLGDVYEKS